MMVAQAAIGIPMKTEVIEPADVRKAAALLNIVLVETISAMAKFSSIAESKISLPNLRLGTAVTLARASCDFGHAITVLVDAHHEELGAPAISLLRSQLELTLRSAFFAFHASDADVEFFFGNDKLKRRPNERGKMKAIYLENLAKIVQSTWEDDERISRSVGLLRNFLNAHVHGGVSLLSRYQGPRGIGYVSSSASTIRTLKYSYAFANLAMIVVAKLADENSNLASEIFHQLYQSAQNFCAEVGLR